MSTPKRSRQLFVGLIIGLLMLPLIPLLDIYGRMDLALPSCMAIGTFAVAIYVCRQERKRLWFWVTITALASAHIPFILYFPWSKGWIPAPLTFLCCIVDFALIIGIVNVVGKLSGWSATRSDEPE